MDTLLLDFERELEPARLWEFSNLPQIRRRSESSHKSPFPWMNFFLENSQLQNFIILQYQAYDVLSEKNIVVRMGRAWHVENSFHSYQRASRGDFIFWQNLNAYYQKSEQWIKVKFGGSSIASLNSSLTLNSTLNAHLVGKLYPLISYIHNKFRLLASCNIS